MGGQQGRGCVWTAGPTASGAGRPGPTGGGHARPGCGASEHPIPLPLSPVSALPPSLPAGGPRAAAVMSHRLTGTQPPLGQKPLCPRVPQTVMDHLA